VRIRFLSRSRNLPQSFRAGVSLHSHTNHSRENLGFIGDFLRRHSLLRQWLQQLEGECQRKSGIRLDFAKAYWTPALTGRLAYELEERQIAALGLDSMVSLSDHDNIEAPMLLRIVPGIRRIPVSVEWTVPFGEAVFHIGVHNLPTPMAENVMSELQAFTARPADRQLGALLHELHRLPSVLVVLNHPLWSQSAISRDRFEFELNRLLGLYGHHIHAFELNGMRCRAENQSVIELAALWNQVLISGGDRHGREPNANLNLTNAADFSEFVDEVRNGRRSTVLFMPQYEENIVLRIYQGFMDTIREYPEYPEAERCWDGRTYHPNLRGEPTPLRELWPKGSPAFLTRIFSAALFLERGPAWEALRALTFKNGQLSLPVEPI
jgi:hypothetical protein